MKTKKEKKAVLQEAIRWQNTNLPKSINEDKFKHLKKAFEDSKHVFVDAISDEIITQAVMAVNTKHIKTDKK